MSQIHRVLMSHVRVNQLEYISTFPKNLEIHSIDFISDDSP